MLIWDDALTLAQWEATDTGSETLTIAKMLMNFNYKQILAKFRRDQNTDTQTAPTVASQRGYLLPPNFLRIKGDSVSFTYGGQLTSLVHVQNEEIWNRFVNTDVTGNRPERYFIRNRFGAFGSEILLDPIPSVVGTLKIDYDATDRDLSATAYTTGTITATQNSVTIAGAGGATFTNAMVGRYLTVTDAAGDGFWYRIASYSSPTSIALEQSYDGATVSGTYKIAEAFALPEEMQILPVYFFLQHYFSKKRNEKKVGEYASLYKAIWDQALIDYNSKDDSSRVFDAKRFNAGFPLATPPNFPSSVS